MERVIYNHVVRHSAQGGVRLGGKGSVLSRVPPSERSETGVPKEGDLRLLLNVLVVIKEVDFKE